MKFGRFSIGLTAGLLLFGSGCAIDDRQQTDTELGGHRVIIQPQCPVTSIRTYESELGMRYELRCGRRLIQVDREHLIIDGYDYGELRAGDVIRLFDALVTIDGMPRSGKQVFTEAL